MTTRDGGRAGGAEAERPAPDRSADFFRTPGISYLSAAAHGPLPRVSVAAARQAMELDQRPHEIRSEDHRRYPEAYREAAASLVGASTEEIALADSATLGIMLAVAGLPWRAGDEVVLPDGEFPANRFPWKSLEAKGVVVREVPIARSGDAVHAIEAAVNERTRLVSVSWVGYSTGRRLDVRAIGTRCRERGVVFVIDGSQGLGGLAFDVRDTPCDLLVAPGYKWLLGPSGTGFAYLDPAFAERLSPHNVSWHSVEGSDDFNRLQACDLTFRPGMRRFDVNAPDRFSTIAAATASIRYLLDISLPVVEAANRALLDRVVDGLPPGFRPLEPLDDAPRSGILCVVNERAGETAAAFERLRKAGVYVSLRENALRIAPHVHNTTDDVDRLLDVLASRGSGARPVRPQPVGPDVADPTPTTPPALRVLEGPTVSLHPIVADRDADDLFREGGGDPARERIWTYMPTGPFASRDAMHAWLTTCEVSTDPLFFAVVSRESGRRIGIVSYLNFVPAMRSVELGHIWYGLTAQRTRVNTESMYLMLSEAFDRLRYRRVEWKCDALNEPSLRAAHRLGFQFEGVFRQHMIVKGRNRDSAWFSMLDRDWPGVRTRLERWLDPETSPYER